MIIFLFNDLYLISVCREGQLTEKLCPDGMVFNDYSPDQEKCDLPINIDCSQRPKLRKHTLLNINTPKLVIIFLQDERQNPKI